MRGKATWGESGATAWGGGWGRARLAPHKAALSWQGGMAPGTALAPGPWCSTKAEPPEPILPSPLAASGHPAPRGRVRGRFGAASLLMGGAHEEECAPSSLPLTDCLPALSFVAQTGLLGCFCFPALRNNNFWPLFFSGNGRVRGDLQIPGEPGSPSPALQLDPSPSAAGTELSWALQSLSGGRSSNRDDDVAPGTSLSWETPFLQPSLLPALLPGCVCVCGAAAALRNGHQKQREKAVHNPNLHALAEREAPALGLSLPASPQRAVESLSWMGFNAVFQLQLRGITGEVIWREQGHPTAELPWCQEALWTCFATG
ncbi:uncharacterized protein LOC116788625 [Chiroxiphia lanceolata]|uniref:uncharacterized protein LOC116788625 n=1 Tax=Chiroxiphia lanceolata TaxID=296741 RepID=UPI0013CE7ACB|nr:uncharacterized protein LOC116788625 [Chiroxiphia lanceolata]